MEKNLEQEEAIKKFKKLAKEIDICMFITATRGHEHDHTRPMSTAHVDDDGTLWFFTDIRSIKVDEVTSQREVHLTYSHPGKQSYMDVWGTGSVVTDKAVMKEKYTPEIKAFWPDGLDDPNIALLQVKPQDVYYWDGGTGKVMLFIKFAVAIATRQPAAADAAEGTLAIG